MRNRRKSNAAGWFLLLMALQLPALLPTVALAASNAPAPAVFAGPSAPASQPAPARPGGGVSDPAKRPLISGTFLQLLEQNGNWERSRWESLFDSLHQLGVRQVVVQWTLHDSRAFFAGQTFGAVARPPLETILELAQARGIEVYLGLAAESGYWEKIRQTPLRQGEYLERLRWKSERVAQEVAAIAARYGAFKGWYLPEEIDDLDWRSPQARGVLVQHLRRLGSFLKQLTPAATILLSGFTSARTDPESYGEFWGTLFRDTPVDVLLFQDAAGTGRLPRELLPAYLKALRGAADANGKKLQVVVELFTEVSADPFKAVPAPLSRLRQQLRTADDYATGGINSFSVPDYMLPDADGAASGLLHDYLKYQGGGQLTAP
jgi:hypothetical protein